MDMKTNLKAATFMALAEVMSGGNIMSGINLPEHERDKITQEERDYLITKAEEKRQRKKAKRAIHKAIGA